MIMKMNVLKKLLPFNCIVLAITILISVAINHAAYQVNQLTPVRTGPTVIIDAGHGMPDGGTTSCTGMLESDLNLEISSRLNDLFHFLGIHTFMTRTDRNSIYTEGNSISQKKISDIRNRVNIVNSTDYAVLLSIHQNHFYDSRYSGAQIFYANNEKSKKLAELMQSEFVSKLNPGNQRKAKKASGVYLMEHIKCTGILIECGFLSNQTEESLLRSSDYQKKLCAVIATSCVSYMNQYGAS